MSDNAHPEYALTLLKAFKDRLVMHNRSFDVLATQQLLHFKMNCVQDDTLLMSFLFDENTNHGLKVLAAKHLGWYNYAENVKDAVSESLTSNFGVVPLNELGEYNCLDAAATWHLYYEYDKRLDTAEKELYKFLLQAQNMYIEATTNGFPVDLTYLGRLKSELENEKADLEVEINSAEEVTTAKKLIALASAGIIDKEALYKEGKVVRVRKLL
jgi:DNA polymerase I-like protein with 3'-5' exonuclease and polymerase domains